MWLEERVGHMRVQRGGRCLKPISICGIKRCTQPLLLLSRSNPPTEGGHQKGASLGITPSSNERGCFSHCARFDFLSRAIDQIDSNRLFLQCAEKARMYVVSGVHHTPESNVACLLAGYLLVPVRVPAMASCHDTPVDWSWRSYSRHHRRLRLRSLRRIFRFRVVLRSF